MKAAQALTVASLLVLMLQAPATARAADQVVARETDSLIGRLFQLGGVTLYQEEGPNPSVTRHAVVPGLWTRVVQGKSRPARHIPPTVGVGDIGRDAKGRIVLTYYLEKTEPDRIPVRRWFIYDVMRDRSRPIKGLNRDEHCFIEIITIWRKRMVFQKTCGDEGTGAGLFSKIGWKVHTIAPDYPIDWLVQRGGSVAGIVEDGVGDLHLFRFMDGGVACVERIPLGFGTGDGYWHPTGVWFSRSKLVWSMGSPDTAPNFALLAAKRTGACKPLGPVGELPFTWETKSVGAMAVDADRLVYAGEAVIKAHRLPSKPSVAPPANDDFEHAQALPTKLPYRISVRIGRAKRQRGEPAVTGPYGQEPSTPNRTVWYAFRPTASGTVWVSSDYHMEGVFTGSNLEDLTQTPPGMRATEVHAEAGKTYWIAVTLDSEEPAYQPFYLTIGTAEPPGE